jgi:hypothetical protein
MDTPGPLTIVIGTQNNSNQLSLERMASNIAQNLYIYFGADVDIRYDIEVDDAFLLGNVISLGMQDENAYLNGVMRMSHLKNPFPIVSQDKTIHINDTTAVHTYSGEGVGAIFLHPLSRDRLLLSICGTDHEGLERAGKLVPYRTGTGQPDWIIVGPTMGVHGMQGVRAMGYYSNLWDIELAVSFFS